MKKIEWCIDYTDSENVYQVGMCILCLIYTCVFCFLTSVYSAKS